MARALNILLQLNFNASIIFLLIVSAISMTGSSFFFENSAELYGPMAANLPLMLVYLSLTEIAVTSFCRFSGNYQALLALGAFLLLLTVSVEFYGVINQVPVDENYRWLFLYLGLSHLAYGWIQVFNRQTQLNTD